jgi:3-phosphoshikimate 1-carboxyvinyltransferase
VKVSRASKLKGRVQVPGDKSISHRAAMFSAIAVGNAEITNFSASEDCTSTLSCLEALGVEVHRSGSTVNVSGTGFRGLREPATVLDCGNSGTTMRLMSGILAGQAFDSVLTGDESLRGRPMRRVIDPLEQMGAAIESEDGRAPLRISGRMLNAIEYRLPVASAQIKSCVLLAGLGADGQTTVIEPTATRDHTERMLNWLGGDVIETFDGQAKHITVTGGRELSARDIQVPGDISAAAFFLVAAACLPDSEITIPGVGMNSTRKAVVDAMQQLGARIEVTNERLQSNEPVADLFVRGGLEPENADPPNVLRGEVIANLIDEVPVLAVFGTQLPGGLEIRDAAELRVKESDRIKAVVENLKRMNAQIEEFPDGLKVGRSDLKGAEIESFGDHRIAMAFAVAGLFADGETEIQGDECAAVSFPTFFEVLEAVKA